MAASPTIYIRFYTIGKDLTYNCYLHATSKILQQPLLSCVKFKNTPTSSLFIETTEELWNYYLMLRKRKNLIIKLGKKCNLRIVGALEEMNSKIKFLHQKFPLLDKHPSNNYKQKLLEEYYRNNFFFDHKLIAQKDNIQFKIFMANVVKLKEENTDSIIIDKNLTDALEDNASSAEFLLHISVDDKGRVRISKETLAEDEGTPSKFRLCYNSYECQALSYNIKRHVVAREINYGRR